MNREQREQYEQGETDHKTFAVLRISRLDLLWTLPFRIMNRERRERHERGPLLPSLLSVLSLERMGKPSPWTLPRTALNLQGTLPFLFAVFACFAVKITADIPFSGGKGELSLRGKSSADTPFFVRDFRAFRG